MRITGPIVACVLGLVACIPSGSKKDSSGSGDFDIDFPGSSSSGSSTSSSGGSGGRTYTSQADCQRLLDAYAGASWATKWTCPTTLTAPKGSFSAPTPSSGTCMRDSYVDAAIQYCWAAECYARLGVDDKMVADGKASMTPATAASRAKAQLANADALCSNAPCVAPCTECDTIEIHPCP